MYDKPFRIVVMLNDKDDINLAMRKTWGPKAMFAVGPDWARMNDHANWVLVGYIYVPSRDGLQIPVIVPREN